MSKHLVLVGGGHAHLTCLKNMREFVGAGHRVTVIGPSPHHFYSGMGPGLLGGTYRPEEIRFNVKKMTEAGGGQFLQDLVTAIRPGEKVLSLASGGTVAYDAASFNVGSRVRTNGLIIHDSAEVFTVKPIEQLLKAREAVLRRRGQGAFNVLVAGGGPAGLEVAGNAWRLVRDAGGQGRITVLAGRRFLSGQAEKTRRLALDSLQKRGIEVLEGAHLREIRPGTALLTDGRTLPADLVFLAMGVAPPSLFRESGLPVGPDGGLLVNEFLQSPDYPEIFGGGDCIHFQPQPLDKVGVYAVRENPVLFRNLLAVLSGQPLISLMADPKYLLIFNLGDGRGVFQKAPLIFGGRAAFWLKDYIDRKFMRSFQVSGELEEK